MPWNTNTTSTWWTKSVAKWKAPLFKQEENALDSWEYEFLNNAERCWWLSNKGTPEYPATWEGVLKVLKDV